MKKPSLLVIFLTVFIDLIGFGIVLPLLALFADKFGASGWVIGALMASFSAMQFIFAPFWGGLSDKIGRRPVLLVSIFSSVIGYAIFGFASGLSGTTALVGLFIARILAGIGGANITVAQAYIADITPPEDRSKKMGLVGMAFGLGFIVGPIIGGLCLDKFGITGPGWVAAGLCLLNVIFAYFRLPESMDPANKLAAPKRPRFAQWRHTLSQPKVGLLILIFFLATFCFACFETTLGLLVSKNFNLDITVKGHHASEIVYLFAYCGIVGAFVQGGAIGKAVKKLGEPKLIILSLLMVAVSLPPLPYCTTWVPLLIMLGILSIGSSLTRPPVFGMISNLTSASEQGVTLGVAQSMGSLARIFGPLFAATLFTLHPTWPYMACGVISALTAVIAVPKLLGTPSSKA
ncbi:MAG: transporter [Verrucomicrobiales bacterium]|nr:transporter [Verrucomicrobiales bacterium]